MPDPFVEMDKALTGHRDSPLNPTHVDEVFEACLNNVAVGADGSLGPDVVTVQGVAHTAVFNRAELAERHAEIGGMLAQLPADFMSADQGGGGGWSFLNMCDDKDGVPWTGLHLVMEKLVLLGLATDQVQWCLPREFWVILPGEMPYLTVTL